MGARLNKMLFIGRLTRDPEAVSFNNGGKAAKFGFAVNNDYKNSQGEWINEAAFIDCEVFNVGANGKMADNVLRLLKKGELVLLEGSLKMDSWVDKTTGGNRTRLKMLVQNFQFIEAKGEGGGSSGGSGGSRASGGGRAPAGRSPNTTSSPGYRDPEPEEGGGVDPNDDIPF